MNATPSLFGECPLPGCINLVDDPRWPCGDCEAALAGYIRPAAQPVTAEEATAMLAERDQAVAGIYAERRIMTPLPEPAEATPGAEPGPAGPAADSDPGSCGARCQPAAQAESAPLGLRGASHLPARSEPPRPLDMQDMRGDHVTATTADVLRGSR